MAKRRLSSRRVCPCTSGLTVSSTLLFLSIILPSTSYAQITEQASSTAPTTSIPSTLSTSILSSSQSSATPDPSSVPFPPLQDPNNNDDDNFTDPAQPVVTEQGAHVFRFYFLIIALVAILFVLLLLYLGRRRKRKAAVLRTNSQRALAQDVAGFHQRFGRNNLGGVGTFFSGGYASRTREVRVEGLDERGEAPPPYIPGTKPPSLRSRSSSSDLGTARINSSGSGHGEGVELRDMNESGNPGTQTVGHGEPPGYQEHLGQNQREEEDLGDMTRPSAPPMVTGPDNAVVVEERTAGQTTRRLLGSSSDVV